MDVDVFLDKNQLLNLVNEKLLKSPSILGKWLVIKDFISVQTVPQPFQLGLRIKWNIRFIPFVERISNIVLILEEGLIPKVFRNGNQITIQGWKSILNDLMAKQIKSLNHLQLEVWPDLNEVGIYIRQVLFQKKTLRISLIISGHLGIELSPEFIPLIHSNGMKFHFVNQNEKYSSLLKINLNVFNSALRNLSKQIPSDISDYMGFAFGKILLKLKKGQLHIITQIKHPFTGYAKTICGIILDEKTGRLKLIDVNSELESNNILAHLAHLGFKKSLHLIIINRLEMIMNLKIKETIIKQMKRIGQLNKVKIDYNLIEIEENVLKLTLNFNGEMKVHPKLFEKSY
jgi:hypothetical protein